MEKIDVKIGSLQIEPKQPCNDISEELTNILLYHHELSIELDLKYFATSIQYRTVFKTNIIKDYFYDKDNNIYRYDKIHHNYDRTPFIVNDVEKDEFKCDGFTCKFFTIKQYDQKYVFNLLYQKLKQRVLDEIHKLEELFDQLRTKENKAWENTDNDKR